MRTYNLVTVWRLPATAKECWDILSRPRNWPEWWPYVERVEILQEGDSQGIGARHLHVWRTCLPYRLRFQLEVVRVLPPAYVAARVRGDLTGVGRCRLRSRGPLTVVRYDWHVHPTKRWMNLAAPLAYPVFLWNHRRVMATGEASLRRMLSAAPASNREAGTTPWRQSR